VSGTTTKTRPTMNCRPGDVVLIRFPFTDLSSSKKRPAVVVSPGEYQKSYGDLVLIPVTSKEQVDSALKIEEWESAGLLKPSWLKPLVATISGTYVLASLGRIDLSDSEALFHAVSCMLDESVLTVAA